MLMCLLSGRLSAQTSDDDRNNSDRRYSAVICYSRRNGTGSKNLLIGDIRMRFLWKLIKWLVGLALILFLAAGLYAGNVAYEELFSAPWDQILGIENRKGELDRIHSLEARNGWQRVEVHSKDGTKLVGTYIPGESGTRNTVILLHGLYQNRTMCIPYANIYRRMGYNVLLADLRGHGESEGGHTDWGIHDVEDMNAWVSLLRSKHPQMQIGFHGVSLGAAMALIYSASDEGKQMKFYVADSSYGDLLDLGRDKLMKYTGDDRLVLGMDVLNPFFQAALYMHTGKLLSDIDPVNRVQHMTSPVLFLHGAKDQLVPPEVAELLLADSSSTNKKLYIFQGASHTMEMSANGPAYREYVTDFIKNT